MSKYIFIKEQDASNKFDTTRVELHSSTVDLDTVIEDFTSFLKASGFYFDRLELHVEKEEEIK